MCYRRAPRGSLPQAPLPPDPLSPEWPPHEQTLPLHGPNTDCSHEMQDSSETVGPGSPGPPPRPGGVSAPVTEGPVMVPEQQPAQGGIWGRTELGPECRG